MTRGADALEKFQLLEDRIERLLAALESARGDKAAAEGELAQARGEIRELQKQIRSLEKQRAKIRERVRVLIASIAALEERRKREDRAGEGLV